MSAQQQGRTEQFNIQLLNSFCKNKKSVYELLSGSLGLFLPKFESRAITEKFLLQGIKKEIFIMERKDISPAPTLKEKVTAVDLLEEIVKMLPGKNLGYDMTTIPDKQYLCDLLYSLKRDHPFFIINSQFNITREFDEK